MQLEAPSLRVGCLVVVIVLAGCAGTAPATETAELRETTTPSPVTAGATDTVAVHFINAGQSASTLVVGPTGETMLIDTGRFSDDGEHVLAYLRARDIDRIDYLVVSHNDADHIGGNAEIIDYYETEADGIGAIYDPGIAASTRAYSDYLDAVEEHDVPRYETRTGDSIRLEDVGVSVLGPPEPYIDNRTRNENSIVLKLAYGETSYLLTGDAESDQEAQLVERHGDRLRTTVLKTGHHGSTTSTSPALLDAASPRRVVISSAYDSEYGHPHPDVLLRLASRSTQTYWTATHGDIVLVTDGRSVTVRTRGAAPTAPLALRDGAPVAPGNGSELAVRETFFAEPAAVQNRSTE